MPLRDVISHDRLKALYAWWADDFGADSFALSKVGPPELQPWLPNVFILDVLPDRNFRYRLTGTEIDRHVGRNMTGMTITQARSGATLAMLQELFSTVAEQGRAGYARSRLADETQTHITYHRLALPMRLAQDGPIARLLGAWYGVWDPNTPPDRKSLHFDPATSRDETEALVRFA
jgi:hypothetical protein